MTKRNHITTAAAITAWATVLAGVVSLHSASASNMPVIPNPGTKPPVPARYECINGDVIGTGKASWYGSKFHGRKTANGERYDMHGMTAAHRKLPLGTRVLVQNVRNGETRIVRINDRGPYVDGRVLDLSYKAAQELGFERQGVTKIIMRSCS